MGEQIEADEEEEYDALGLSDFGVRSLNTSRFPSRMPSRRPSNELLRSTRSSATGSLISTRNPSTEDLIDQARKQTDNAVKMDGEIEEEEKDFQRAKNVLPDYDFLDGLTDFERRQFNLIGTEKEKEYKKLTIFDNSQKMVDIMISQFLRNPETARRNITEWIRFSWKAMWSGRAGETWS